MRLSLYRMRPLGDRLVTETGADFDEAGYSRFKYGDGTLAENYGRELAARLLAGRPELVGRGEPAVIASAPYKHLPTASHELALSVRRAVNAVLAGAGHPSAGLGALRMSRVDCADYARLGTSPRRELLARAGLWAKAADFAGRHVVLVDDARITGAAEAVATELVTKAGARTVTALYVVEYAPDGRGTFRPDIENRINQAFVRDLGSLLQVYRSKRFVLNIRTVKYLLGWPDHDELDTFFGRLTDAELNAIDDAARRSGPDFTRHHAEPLRRLRAALCRLTADGVAGGTRSDRPGGSRPRPHHRHRGAHA